MDSEFIYKNVYAERKGMYIIKPRALINTILLWVYTFNAVLIPYDNFGLKKASFAVLVILNLDIIINGLRSRSESRCVLLMGLILPIYTILKSALLTGNIIDNFLSGYTGMILLILYVIRHFDIPFEDLFTKISIVLAVLVDVSVLLDFMGILPVFSNPILSWMYSTSNANIGKGSGYLLGYYIFIKTTPMLLLSLGLLLNKKRFVWAVVVLLALAFSGTRANAVLAILIFGAAFIIAEKNRTRRIIAIALIIIFAGYILFGQGLLAKYLAFSSGKVNSDAIRKATLPSIVATWKMNPLSLFIGQGYSSEFYNAGRLSWSSDSELAYWNLLRRVGFFCFILMMYCYIKPIRQTIRNRKSPAVAIGYTAYLVGAYVNPLLYTSTGLTVLLCIYAYAYQKEEEILP